MQVEGDASDSTGPQCPFLWLKTADPDFVVPGYPPGTDVRVLLPAGERFEPLRNRLTAQGVPFREVGYLLEHEIICNLTADGGLYVAVGAHGAPARQPRPLAGAAAEAARTGSNSCGTTTSPPAKPRHGRCPSTG